MEEVLQMDKPTEQEAYDLLEQLDIPYERIDHEPITSVRNYEGTLPVTQVKNLLLKTRKGKQFYHVILPDEKIANLKALAEELDCSRLSFASPEELDRLIGLPPGTLTPLAIHHDEEQAIQVVIDRSIARDAKLGFHPNINTTTLMISFVNLERFLSWAKHPPVYKAI